MLHTIQDVKNEWQRLGAKGHLCEYIGRWYLHTYDHANNFVGFKRRGV